MVLVPEQCKAKRLFATVDWKFLPNLKFLEGGNVLAKT